MTNEVTITPKNKITNLERLLILYYAREREFFNNLNDLFETLCNEQTFQAQVSFKKNDGLNQLLNEVAIQISTRKYLTWIIDLGNPNTYTNAKVDDEVKTRILKEIKIFILLIQECAAIQSNEKSILTVTLKKNWRDILTRRLDKLAQPTLEEDDSLQKFTQRDQKNTLTNFTQQNDLEVSLITPSPTFNEIEIIGIQTQKKPVTERETPVPLKNNDTSTKNYALLYKFYALMNKIMNIFSAQSTIKSLESQIEIEIEKINNLLDNMSRTDKLLFANDIKLIQQFLKNEKKSLHNHENSVNKEQYDEIRNNLLFFFYLKIKEESNKMKSIRNYIGLNEYGLTELWIDNPYKKETDTKENDEKNICFQQSITAKEVLRSKKTNFSMKDSLLKKAVVNTCMTHFTTNRSLTEERKENENLPPTATLEKKEQNSINNEPLNSLLENIDENYQKELKKMRFKKNNLKKDFQLLATFFASISLLCFLFMILCFFIPASILFPPFFPIVLGGIALIVGLHLTTASFWILSNDTHELSEELKSLSLE